jgi:hypothetical protein
MRKSRQRSKPFSIFQLPFSHCQHAALNPNDKCQMRNDEWKIVWLAAETACPGKYLLEREEEP